MFLKLCLGTAQFGLPYGITNNLGQVSEKEVAQLLLEANASDIIFIDTAQSYGNSEEILGRNLPIGNSFRVISKMSATQKSSFVASDALIWEREFQLSRKRLKLESMDSWLLHAPAELSKPGANYLEDWLFGLRQRGLVQRLGVSIYTADDLQGVNPGLLDIVQLPLSLFDQRLLQDGTLARLRAAGTAIHARSLYLQGLLLTPAEQWPPWVSPEVRAHQHALEALAQEKGCQLIHLALGFARVQEDLETVVIGVCSCYELAELSAAWSATSLLQNIDWGSWALNEQLFLDPRRWPIL